LRGRVPRGLRHAPRDPGRRCPGGGVDGAGGGGPGGLRDGGGAADGALRLGGGSGPPAEDGARSGTKRATERDRGEDRRQCERPRLADDAGASPRGRRRAGDPPDGGRLRPAAAAGGSGALRRLRDLFRGRRQRGGASRVPQGVARGEGGKGKGEGDAPGSSRGLTEVGRSASPFIPPLSPKNYCASETFSLL